MSEYKKTSVEDIEQVISDAENRYSQALSNALIKTFGILFVFFIYVTIPKTFWLIPSQIAAKKVNPYQEPIIIENIENIKASDLTKKSDYNKLIKIKSLKNKKSYYLMPLADYSISARLKDKNKFFYLQWDIDNVALVDYGLICGDMARDKYFKKISCNSNQTVMGRMLVYNFKDKYNFLYRDKIDYLIAHVSHTHIIPANKKIKKALDAVKIGQAVKLDGYLVDVYDDNYFRFAMSSLSLTDTNETSRGHGRGGGACEVMYVTKVQVGRKIFK